MLSNDNISWWEGTNDAALCRDNPVGLKTRDGYEPNHDAKFVENFALLAIHELNFMIGLLL